MISNNLKFFIKISFFYLFLNINIFSEELLIDSRIRRVLFQEGNVLNLMLRPNYQTVIEFEKEEEIEVISFGDSYGWDIKQIDNKFFIKPLEFNLKTNMHIYTNKGRCYLFDLYSVDISDPDTILDDIVYYLSFFYIDSNVQKEINNINASRVKMNMLEASKKINSIQNEDEKSPEDVIKSFDNIEPSKEEISFPAASDKKLNLNYSFAVKQIDNSEESRIIYDRMMPTAVFDDGTKVYFKFKNNNYQIPLIFDVSKTGNETLLTSYIEGDFVVVDTLSAQFVLRLKDRKSGTEYAICIFRDSFLKTVGKKIQNSK